MLLYMKGVRSQYVFSAHSYVRKLLCEATV